MINGGPARYIGRDNNPNYFGADIINIFYHHHRCILLNRSMRSDGDMFKGVLLTIFFEQAAKLETDDKSI
jgi:hypothetical protein